MENYIINNKTIALIKKNKKTVIISVDKTEVINKSIKKIIDLSCNFYGSSLEGRINSASTILNNKYKLPILIDDNNITLIQMNSPRNKNCIYLVTNKIINYEILNNLLKIYCVNNVSFKLKLSKNCFEKMLLNSFRINNVLFYRKNGKFL